MTKRSREFLELVERLRCETEAARGLLTSRLGTKLIDTFPLRHEWMTVGMVTALVDAVGARHTTHGANRRQLAELATLIAEQLDDSYPVILRAQSIAKAWLAAARLHEELHEFDEAHRALDRAASAVADYGTLMHDEALVALARASVLIEQGQVARAEMLLAAAQHVFDVHNDRPNVARCELLRGCLAERTGDHLGARSTYRSAVAIARNASDLHGVANTLVRLAIMEARRCEPSAARSALLEAEAALGQIASSTFEVAHARWLVGEAFLGAGECRRAIPLVRAARSGFQSIGRVELAGLAGLTLGAAYLADGQRGAAQRVFRVMLGEWRDANLTDVAIEAVANLCDASAAVSVATRSALYASVLRLRDEFRGLAA